MVLAVLPPKSLSSLTNCKAPALIPVKAEPSNAGKAPLKLLDDKDAVSYTHLTLPTKRIV